MRHLVNAQHVYGKKTSRKTPVRKFTTAEFSSNFQNVKYSDGSAYPFRKIVFVDSNRSPGQI